MPRIVTLLEAFGIGACTVLLLRAFVQVGWQAGWPAALYVGLALPVGYYAADLLSGLIHWVCDTFGDSQTPLWGPMLVAPFRRHHLAPGDITHISLTENLGASALVGVLVLWLWAPSESVPAGGAALLAWASGLWCIGFAVLSNRFHRWAHLPLGRRPPWLRQLQAWRVVLRPHEHALHHRKPHRTHYCILSGWANPLCNRLPWTRLEAALAWVGIRTHVE